ncbi:MAG: hypothetical protein ACPG4Z_05690 [Chitinophagales bacterium]
MSFGSPSTSVKNNRALLKRKHRGKSHGYKYGKNQKGLRFKKLSPEEQKVVDANTRRIEKRNRDRKYTLIVILILTLTAIAVWTITN